jgi:hypothetical protein
VGIIPGGVHVPLLAPGSGAERRRFFFAGIPGSQRMEIASAWF